MTRRRARIALAAVVVLAAALRLRGIGEQSLWIDETYSALAARMPLREMVETTAGDVHPPTYYALLAGWMQVFGTSEAALRSLSALFSVATVAWIGVLATALFRDRRAGLLAALLSAILTFHVEYAREARSYSMLLFLAVGATHALWRWRGTGRRAWAVGYVLLLAALLWTHAHAVFVVLAHGIFVFARPRGEARGPSRVAWTVAALGALVLFTPWLPTFFETARRVAKRYWIPRPGLPDLPATFAAFAGTGIAAAILGVLAVVALATRGGRHGEGGARTRLLACWLLAPIVAPFLVSQRRSSIYLDRTVISASAAFVVLAAGGLAWILRRPFRGAGPFARCVGAAAVVAALLATGRGTARMLRREHKEEWRQATAFTEASAEPGATLAIGEHGEIQSWRWYARRTDLHVIGPRDPESVRGAGPIVWWVRSVHTRADVGDPFERALVEAGYEPLAAREFFLITVRPWRRR